MSFYGDRTSWWFIKGDASSWENNSYKDNGYMLDGDRVIMMYDSRDLDSASHMYKGLACSKDGPYAYDF
jgi:hypothetical protein